MHVDGSVCSLDPWEMQTVGISSALGRNPQILCNQIPWLCSCEVTGNFSACPSSQPSTLSWCSFRAAKYLDVIGVCEKHRDAVDAHAPATRGGQPVLQGGAEGFIYEHGLIVTSGLGLEDRTTRTVTLPGCMLWRLSEHVKTIRGISIPALLWTPSTCWKLASQELQDGAISFEDLKVRTDEPYPRTYASFSAKWKAFHCLGLCESSAVDFQRLMIPTVSLPLPEPPISGSARAASPWLLCLPIPRPPQ